MEDKLWELRVVYKERYIKEAYKIIHRIAKVNQELLFTKSHNAAVRDNAMKLSKSKYKGRLIVFPTKYCYTALFFAIYSCRAEV